MNESANEQLKTCKKCGKETVHTREKSKTSGPMILVHFLLGVATFGAWLIFIVTYKMFYTPIGGWKCSECGSYL